jgi:shikimate kinase
VRGVSRSSAALTVVNALPTGTGCAIGFGRFVTATANLEPDRTAAFDCTPTESATPLVRASVAAALARFGRGGAVHTTLQLQSEVPVARGLKSSSAVSTATIRAVARALGDEPNPLTVARIAAEVGRSVGVSASGALDDALASLRPGFVITDNRTDSLIGEGKADPAWSAVVYVPPGQHPPSPSVRERFEAEAPAAHLAVSDVLAGRFLNAMEKNTELVERVMGYEYSALRVDLARAGALASSVSGLGPALVALVPSEHQTEALNCLPRPGERFVARLTSGGTP